RATATRSACRRRGRDGPCWSFRAPIMRCARGWPASGRRSPAGWPSCLGWSSRNLPISRLAPYPSRMGDQLDYDVIVIGSGFGGSVTALRLTEKGYRVGVLEAGRRFADADFARNSWHLRQFLWAPRLGCYGIQRIHPLRDTVVLAGAGVGGGSLNYAN